MWLKRHIKVEPGHEFLWYLLQSSLPNVLINGALKDTFKAQMAVPVIKAFGHYGTMPWTTRSSCQPYHSIGCWDLQANCSVTKITWYLKLVRLLFQELKWLLRPIVVSVSTVSWCPGEIMQTTLMMWWLLFPAEPEKGGCYPSRASSQSFTPFAGPVSQTCLLASGTFTLAHVDIPALIVQRPSWRFCMKVLRVEKKCFTVSRNILRPLLSKFQQFCNI